MLSGLDLTRTARSLLNLEVNTILCDNMTAEEMPALPHALLDIATGYADELCLMGLDLPRIFDLPGGVPPPNSPSWVKPPAAWVGALLTVSKDTFDQLRWAAQWAITSKDPGAAKLAANQRVLLSRIVNNCDTIKVMFDHFDQTVQPFLGKKRGDLVKMRIDPATYDIPPDDLVQLQKIWDIGTDEIVAQTIVFVSGDVTTRVQRSLGLLPSEWLLTIHRQSIDISISRWRDLLDTVKELAGGALHLLMPGRSSL